MIPDGMERIRNARILVVEDNPANQTLARDLLTHAGLAVDLAENGQIAVDAIRNAETPYDAVLMDVQMPVMDGLEASRIIRGELEQRDLPIIATTANVQDSERERCFAAGADDCLAKPFDIPTLFATLLRVVSSRLDGNGRGADNGADPLAAKASLLDREDVEIILPEAIDGIDVELGMKRAGESRDLYASLLIGFAETNASASSVIGDAAMNGDLDRVRFVAHGVRSTAGNIGADALSQAAGALEEAISSGGRVAPALKSFQAELDKVVSAIIASGVAISRKSAPRTASDSPMAVDEIAAIIDRLDTMLEDQDLGAEDEFGKLAELLGGRGYDAPLDRLEASLDALEYAHAKGVLESLREDLLN